MRSSQPSSHHTLLGNLDAVILAGGLGTRLRPVVSDAPKCLAMVNDLPFLAHKIRQLRQAGVRRAIVCVGYMAEHIIQYFKANPIPDISLVFSIENDLLGTAGALKNAEPWLVSERFLVLNGDCYLDINYSGFVAQHTETMAHASLALVRVEDPSRYGLVMFNQEREIQAFLEKQKTAPATVPEAAFYINAGTYCFERAILEHIPMGRPCSLEREIFPNLIDHGFYAYPVMGYFIDIGTPESFAQIQQDILTGKLKVAS